MESIANAFGSFEYSVGEFIGLKKAFDTINHNILIDYHYGIRGSVLEWTLIS